MCFHGLAMMRMVIGRKGVESRIQRQMTHVVLNLFPNNQQAYQPHEHSHFGYEMCEQGGGGRPPYARKCNE